MGNSDVEKWDSLGIEYWQNRSVRQRWAHEYLLHPEFLRLIRSLEKLSFSKLLDFGCGDGSLLQYFRTHDLKYECFGYDRSQILMQIARKNHPDFNYINNLDNQTFDVICLNMVIQDVANPIALLNELGTAMNGSGILIISIPHPVFSLIQSQHFTTLRKIKNPSNQKDIYRYRFEESEEVFWNDNCSTSTNLYNRTLATYVGFIRSSKLKIIDITEPYPIEQGQNDTELYNMHCLIPKFLFIVACKQ